MRRPSAVGLLVLAVLLGPAGCSPPGEDTPGDTVADTTTAPDQPAARQAGGAEARLDSGTANEPYVHAETEDPFAVYGVQDPSGVRATNQTTPVWLVNRHGSSIVVRAEAGAGQVVLDTIPAEDSVLVRIETRADSVRLEARMATGSEAGSAVVRSDGTPGRVAFPR